MSINKEQLRAALIKISEGIDKEPRNATIRLGSSIVITPEQTGRKTNIEKALTELSDKLTGGFSLTYQLPVDIVTPDIVAKDYEGIDGLVASFTTPIQHI